MNMIEMPDEAVGFFASKAWAAVTYITMGVFIALLTIGGLVLLGVMKPILDFIPSWATSLILILAPLFWSAYSTARKKQCKQ